MGSAHGPLEMTMRNVVWITLLLAVASLSVPGETFAKMNGQGRHMGSYGGYCKGPKWGWYGAGHHVRSEEEVRDLVSDFLAGTELTVGEIREQETYFEVDIKDKEGEVVDLLIVDKRSCRIRSAY